MRKRASIQALHQANHMTDTSASGNETARRTSHLGQEQSKAVATGPIQIADMLARLVGFRTARGDPAAIIG